MIKHGVFTPILMGDKNNTVFDRSKLSTILKGDVVDMREYCKTDTFKRLQAETGLNGRKLQTLIYHSLDVRDFKSIHAGNRSGTLDSIGFFSDKSKCLVPH